MTIRMLFLLPIILISVGCVTPKQKSIDDAVGRLMALDGSVYFDKAQPYFSGRLQKLSYLGTDKALDAQGRDEGREVLAKCIRVETAGRNVNYLPDALMISTVFSCLNRSGWTVVYEDLVID